MSGVILSTLAAITVPLVMNRTLEMKNGEILGYTSMALAFIAVFLGIRSYRENQGGGAITFGRAFKVGILITLITCAVYVIGWEIVFWGFIPDFGDKYAAFALEKMARDGATSAELAKATAEMERFKVLYRNPLFNVAVTFVEVFPIGLIVTLVSAAILRKKASTVLATA
jgi:hypothetical protein